MDQAKSTANDIFNDIGKEVYRQGNFGAQELASAIFSGNAFVLYGGRESSNEQQMQQEQEHGHEREGMAR
jgi:hypothetical protein